MSKHTDKTPISTEIAEVADIYRVSAYLELSAEERALRGQFFTPSPVARFMVTLFSDPPEAVELLDAGAGVRALTAAFIEDACQRSKSDSHCSSLNGRGKATNQI